MPRLHPFRAVRYTAEAGDAGDLLAPPYDVITAGEAEELRDRSPYNAVRLVLPEGEVPGRYAAAAERLREWRSEGVLAEEAEPAAFAYAQSFARDGGWVTRRGLLAAVEATPFGAGQVLPHEETHRGPKRDRLALTEATGAQLSPVFLVAPDSDGRLLEALRGASEGEAPGAGSGELLARTPDGADHRVREISPGKRGDVLAAAGGLPLLVADGHHRYETALELARRHPDREPAGRVLACVVSARDPGLTVLPTHRALARPPEGGWNALVEDRFEVEGLTSREPAAAARAAAEAGGASLALLPGGEGRARVLRPRRSALEEVELERPEAGLPPVVFDRLVLRAGFGRGADRAAEEGLLSYHRDPAEAVGAAGRQGAAFLLRGLEVREVWEAARAGVRLPPKSTYFWPKLPSGLVFRRLWEP